MPLERNPNRTENFAALQGCFVGGDPEQRRREGKTRRRAIALSVVLQSVAVAALILVPLFGRTERLSAKQWVPIPPYNPYRQPVHEDTGVRVQHPRQHFSLNVFSQPASIPARIFEGPATEPQEPFSGAGTRDDTGLSGGPACAADCIPIDDGRRQPVRPVEEIQRTPTRISVTHLEQAMLIQRVEPDYPTLARQTRREGQVELRAIIATDGTVQSLQVVRGDAMFYQSALDAVRQWRYRPTVLNGRPVEIDTYITVIYNMPH